MLENLEKAPLPVLKKFLDDKFQGDSWKNYEIETISLEFQEYFSELFRDKLAVLQLLMLDPNFFYEDILFFLHASTVANNHVTEFEVLPLPTSLEIAFAAISVSQLFPGEFSEGVRKTVVHILTNEGYSKALPPFDSLFKITDSMLVPGQTETDTSGKAKAISLYLKEMNRWPQ